MWIMVEHLHKEKRSGIFRYRRRVPPELQGVLGKKTFDISLKTKDAAAARVKRDKVHTEIEALLATASSPGLECTCDDGLRGQVRGSAIKPLVSTLASLLRKIIGQVHFLHYSVFQPLQSLSAMRIFRARTHMRGTTR